MEKVTLHYNALQPSCLPSILRKRKLILKIFLPVYMFCGLLPFIVCVYVCIMQQFQSRTKKEFTIL